MVSDRWENTYSCKSGASAGSHANATCPTHCSVRGNQIQWTNHAERKGREDEAEDIKRGEGEGGSQTHLVLAISLPAEQLGLLCAI